MEEKDNQKYQNVMELLSDHYKILGMSWEEDHPVPPGKSGRTGDDLGSSLSQAIDSLRQSQA